MSLNIRLYEKELLNLNIDESLNRKIIQNENKLLSLFIEPKKKREYHSIDQKAINRGRNKNIKKKYIKKKNNINITSTYCNSFDDNDSETNKNTSQLLSPRSKISLNYYDYDKSPKSQRNVIKVNQKVKTFKNKSNKSTRSNFSAPKYKNNISKNINRRINKKNPKKQISNYSVKKHSNNLNNSNTHVRYNTIDFASKNDRCFSPPPKNINVDDMMVRFKMGEDKKKEWIESQKKKKEEEERKLCSYAPKINKNSKKINLKFKDDFLGRQKLKDEQKKKKEEKLIAFLNKKKEDEINKSNILLKKKNIKSKGVSMEKNKKVKIDNAINKLYQWDEKRKEKINERRKKNKETIERNKHIPQINKRSASMAELKNKKYSNKSTFDRLAQLDPEQVEKRRLLVQLYTPSFRPNIRTQKVQAEEDKEVFVKKGEKEDTKRQKDDETNGIISLSNQYLSDDDIQELYRSTIFQKRKSNN